MHEIEIKAFGFALSAHLVVAIGDALEASDVFVDPIVAADTQTGALEVSVEVKAPSEADARQLVSQAVGEALVAAGAVEGWTRAARGQAVIA